jgi:hypothetical protein
MVEVAPNGVAVLRAKIRAMIGAWNGSFSEAERTLLADGILELLVRCAESHRARSGSLGDDQWLVRALIPGNAAGRQRPHNGSTAGGEEREPPVEGRFYWEDSVDPELINRAFQTAIAEQNSGYGGKPRRKPIRFSQVWSVFRGRETEMIPLDEIAGHFAGVKNPRQTAATTISRLNAAFRQLDIDLEIETRFCTAYRFKRRSPGI